jgi:uncharacterized circularly permuted ATP-grasp superfamily protein/uncharacterized alpha-E superfamily protein
MARGAWASVASASESAGAPSKNGVGDVYDEFWLAPDEPRPHQRLLADRLLSRPPEQLDQLVQTIRRRITEQEVTFNILGAPDGSNRPWQLDAIPFVFAPAEWKVLSRGLSQRARVLEALLKDLYGPRRLLREGIIPPDLVFNNPLYWRPCHNWEPVGGDRLHLYAADIAHAPSGNFVVYSDRTAAPTGAGYALENRLVIGRTLGGLFREYGVRRLARFFDHLRATLESVSRRLRSEPRIVVMSAGAQDESSFEHAYLARYLGFELVEGRDLTVRDGGVFLKTLSGLQRVDGILRRVFDAGCDPLELADSAHTGIPGLVSVAASGQVAVVNSLGSSLAESPVFKAYLPAICRSLTGEELELESVPTFWCGDPTSLSHVIANLEHMVLKPAFEERRGPLIRPALMSEGERASLIERLKTQGRGYVAESWPELPLAPYWGRGGPSSGTVSLRTFLCRSHDDFDVMPGGLARLTKVPDGLFLTRTPDELSKDVWVLAQGEASSMPPLAMPDQRVLLRRGGLDLPSRLLDDQYWLGRYVERCDSASRLVRAGFERIGLEYDDRALAPLGAILETLRAARAIPTGAEVPSPKAARELLAVAEELLQGCLFNREWPANLFSMVRAVHDLTLRVRSRLSRDAWHVLRRFTTSLDDAQGASGGPGQAIEYINELLITSAAMSGTSLDNMVRGHAWIFLDIGRRAERAVQTLLLLRGLLPAGATRHHIQALLEIADSMLTYRARYLSALQVAPAVDLLLTDDTNPRSLIFQVNTLLGHLDKLPRGRDPQLSAAERRLIVLRSNLLTADIVEACAEDGSGIRQLVEDSLTLVWQFSDDLGQQWFSHAARPQVLVAPHWLDEDLEGT